MRQAAAAIIMACYLPAFAQTSPGVPSPPSVVSPAPPAVTPRERPFYLEAGTFYSSLSRGYGVFRGFDARLFYKMRKATPILSIGTQSHGEGSQVSFGLSSYITLNSRFYSIVGISHAPDRGVVLYPKTRMDAALLGSVPGVPGLVLSAGVTDFRGSTPRSGGQIFSTGSLYYRGRTISGAVFRVNRDRRSGATSYSEQIGTQYGQQGRYWVGGSITHGTEAYQLGGPVPFDVRWEGVGGSVFVQKWLARTHGLSFRYDYEHKFTAYVRSGGALSYFVDF